MRKITRAAAVSVVLSLILSCPGLAPYRAAAAGFESGRGGAKGPTLPIIGILGSGAAPELPAVPALPNAETASIPPVAAVPAGPQLPAMVRAESARFPGAPASLEHPAAGLDAARPEAARPASAVLGAMAQPRPVQALAEGGKGDSGRGFDTPQGPGSDASVPAPAAPEAAAAAKGFVPANRKIAALAALLQKDPAAGLAEIVKVLGDASERRMEVQLGSLRLLTGVPLEMSREPLLAYVERLNQEKPRLLLAAQRDEIYYLQREALKALAKAPADERLIAAARKAYEDPNPSVRLMAKSALQGWKVEPGPEREPAPAKAEQALGRWAQNASPQPSGAGRFVRLALVVVAALFMLQLFTARPTPPPAPEKPVAAQVEPGTPPPSQQESLKSIADETKRSAEANERSAKALEKMSTPKEQSAGSMIMGFIMALLPIFLIIGLLVWMQKRMGGAISGAKNSKLVEERPKTRFSDVAGIDESQIEIQEIMDFLQNPAKYQRMGARVPKGVLMKGPPGTGKTLLAKAMAGEAGVPFFSISGSDFVELYVGVGAARVRGLFEQALAKAPCIIFIDEIDAIGKSRGGMQSHDEREQTLNALLTQMDGFDGSRGVIVMAATNRPEVLDPALVRPGRFDRHIDVSPPEVLGREAILQVHARRARLGPEADLRYVARRTAGLSGAFLEGVVNEAALTAVRRGQDSIGLADLDEAVDAVTIGKARHLHLPAALKKRIAVHEAGHALANLLGPNPSPVNKFTIIPHGTKALGFAESGSEEGDKPLYTHDELVARVEMALGGLVAEKMFYKQWSTGPGSDLVQATKVVRAMVRELGMGQKTGLAVTSPDRENPMGTSPVSPDTQRETDLEVNRILDEALANVTKRLTEHKDKLDALIAAVLEKETLTREEIEAVVWPDGKTPFGESAPR